jgi:hypothetical protein
VSTSTNKESANSNNNDNDNKPLSHHHHDNSGIQLLMAHKKQTNTPPNSRSKTEEKKRIGKEGKRTGGRTDIPAHPHQVARIAVKKKKKERNLFVRVASQQHG